MRIAVNTRHLLDNRLEGIGIVIDEIMRRMVNQHPHDQFDYYFDRPFQSRFIHGLNVQPHAFGPVTRLPVLIRYWLNHPVKKSVQKNKAAVFFSPDGFLPLGLKIPKIGMVHDVAFVRYPEHLLPRIRRFYKNWMRRYIQEANHLITVSEFSKRELMQVYQLPAEKISVVYNGLTQSYAPISEQEQQNVRNQYSGGKPYFIFVGAIHPRKNITTLVQAFEIFRSTHASDYQLVIAGRPSWNTTAILEAIAASRFSKEIHLPGYVSTELAKNLVGAAAASINPSLYEGFGLPIVEAMACGVPVICSNVASQPEVAAGAALLFEPLNAEELADQMESVTRDSILRQEMIKRGFERSQFFSWDKSAEAVYKVFEKVIR